MPHQILPYADLIISPEKRKVFEGNGKCSQNMNTNKLQIASDFICLASKRVVYQVPIRLDDMEFLRRLSFRYTKIFSFSEVQLRKCFILSIESRIFENRYIIHNGSAASGGDVVDK